MLEGLTRYAIGACGLALMMVGCSSDMAGSVQPVEAYPLRQALGGVRVALDPLFSKEKAGASFPGGEAFALQGLLPIQVLIENGSRQSIRADRADFRLIRPTGQTDIAMSTQDAFSLVKPPVGWWAALPILGPSASALRNADWSKQFESRALKDAPIAPEASAIGLVYFPFPESEQDLAGTRVAFVLRAESGEERSFEIPLQGRRGLLSPGPEADASRPTSRPVQTQEVPTRVEGVGGGLIIRSPAPQ
jgi:hypothetical protein